MAERSEPFAAPTPLHAGHDLANFDSGEPTLDDWLRRRALANMAAMASKTYVVCPPETRRVVGYYALAMGQIVQDEATASMRRNMPRHIPAVVLARLAVDRAFQRSGLGRALLKDAVDRAAAAANDVSARLVLVHAISPAAEAFYMRFGFVRLPVEAPAYALDLVKYARLVAGR